MTPSLARLKLTEGGDYKCVVSAGSIFHNIPLKHETAIKTLLINSLVVFEINEDSISHPFKNRNIQNILPKTYGC